MSKVVIIAEAGVNHNGDINLAKKLVDVASEAGADYVKFQTFKADKIASKTTDKAAYQKKTTDSEESQLQMLKKLELSYEDHLELIDHCQKRSIQFLSTPFDLESIQLLQQLGITLGKVPSGEITNLPYLQAMGKTFSKIVISTGMATMQEIKEAVQVLISAGAKNENITILHCNSEYPTPMEDVNLHAMNHIGKELGMAVGYSDHTLGIEVPIAAVALGAKVIEKHFTLNRNMEGPDHRASLEPSELKAMVTAIRNIEKAIVGSGFKEPSLSELKNIGIGRKSIVANKYIRKGEVFTNENLTTKRPGTGISPMLWHSVLGKVSNRNYDPDEQIKLDL